MENYKQSFGIKSWAEEDRPREKLLGKGRHVLTEAELIAILIGSGSKDETAGGCREGEEDGGGEKGEGG